MMGANVTVHTGKNPYVRKYVFEFQPDNDRKAVAEAVLYKYPTYNERTVICCSTQSGCPVGCRFCGTGDYFVRSLTGDEIVAQVDHLFADEQIDPAAVDRLQIMFMSMGEPLLNRNGLVGALRVLYVKYPRARLLISTSAPAVDYGWVNAVSVEIPTVGLQFSVHESTDAARDALVPFKAKLTLAGIARAGEDWFLATARKPFLNYCAHDGNTAAADVDRLLALYDPAVWCATISVICERGELVSAANDRQRQLATDFEAKMMAAGYDTRTFDPAGQDDIGGGCGQLWYVQQWMRDHPESARPSVGNGLQQVHTPAP